MSLIYILFPCSTIIEGLGAFRMTFLNSFILITTSKQSTGIHVNFLFHCIEVPSNLGLSFSPFYWFLHNLMTSLSSSLLFLFMMATISPIFSLFACWCGHLWKFPSYVLKWVKFFKSTTVYFHMFIQVFNVDLVWSIYLQHVHHLWGIEICKFKVRRRHQRSCLP